jgi:hypothetical protein
LRRQVSVEQVVVYSIYHRTSYSYLTLGEREKELGVLDGGGEKRRSG